MADFIEQIITSNTDSAVMTTNKGGALVLELHNTEGAIDATLETSLNSGGSWVAMSDAAGTAMAASFSTAGYARFEVLATRGSDYRISTINNSGGNLIIKAFMASRD